MDLGLAGKSAIVTGSSRGIGRAIALALASEGARVVLSARTAGPLVDATAEAKRVAAPAGGDAVAVVCDVTTPAGVSALVDGARASFGGVDILINNVGGSGARDFHDCDESDLAAILDRNLWPAFRCSRAVLPELRARGGGSIVMITSIWGREAGGGPSYNVAKAAELALAKAMSRDLAKDNVRVNAVAPGSILFPGGGWERRQKADPEGIAAFVAREVPFQRFGTPEEVADVVTFLCSARARWVHGACVVVDGGQSRAF
ncbi:MAG: short-chain dehydrogenase/reductase [Myxococcales bacterium]|nr:short-chain dehydrogenase/reductase [Myxococcales bacterium]